MKDNIIQLPLRQNARYGEPQHTLSERLRATTRLPKSDRPVMASNLGRMAARLNEDNSIASVKAMFEIAWPGDSTKWAKRKRLVRITGEELGDPENYGSYEAAGAPYLHLAHAVARMSLTSVNEENLAAERERCVADLLWGTSFRPRASSADETTVDARNLMVQLASNVENQVSETGIQKLWEILNDSPFRRINFDFAFKNYSYGKDLIPIKSADGVILNFHNAQEFPELYREMVGWSRPKVFLGWILRRFEVDLLVPPKEIILHSDQYNNSEDPALRKLESWVDEWTEMGPNGRNNELPTHYFDENLDHGWIQTEFDVVSSVYLRAEPDGSNGIKITLYFDDCADGECEPLILPSGCIDNLKSSGLIRMYLEKNAKNDSHTCCDNGVFFDGFWKHYFPEDLETDFIFSARDPRTLESFSLSRRIHSGHFLGVVYFPEGPNTPQAPGDITLSESADGEAAGLLFGANTHFVSVLPEAAGVPVPCRANSLAASLLRNGIFGEEEKILSHILREQAERISEEGLQFFNGIVDLYKKSLK